MVDSYVALNPGEGNAASHVSWTKVACAIVLQFVGVAFFFVRAISLSERPVKLPPYGPFDALRTVLMPFVGLLVVSCISIALLYNGTSCGKQSFFRERGVSMCTRLASHLPNPTFQRTAPRPLN
jgi:hypothetical protein